MIGGFLYSCIEHYKVLAPKYDKYYEAQSQAKVEFICKHISIKQDDQLIDIGGGTAQISLMLKDRLKLTKPVVCVDPSTEMLQVAERNGAITVQATAEDFLKSKPPYPLRLVLLIGCVHHFEDPGFVFSSLTRFMPEDGMCVLLEYPSETTVPLFMAAKAAFTTVGDRLLDVQRLAESKGFTSKLVSGFEEAEVDKELWYEAIRNRLATVLLNFTDEELEIGIEELEEEFADRHVIKFDLAMQVIVLTKT